MKPMTLFHGGDRAAHCCNCLCPLVSSHPWNKTLIPMRWGTWLRAKRPGMLAGWHQPLLWDSCPLLQPSLVQGITLHLIVIDGFHRRSAKHPESAPEFASRYRNKSTTRLHGARWVWQRGFPSLSTSCTAGLDRSVLFIHRFEKLLKPFCMRLVKSWILLVYVHDPMVCSEAAVIWNISLGCLAEVIYYLGRKHT